MAGLSGGGSGGGASGIRAGRAFVECSLDDSAMQRSLARMQAKFRAFGLGLAKVGGGLIGGGLSVLAPMAAAFGEVLNHFDDVAKAADRLGTTTEIFSSLTYAAQQSGSTAEDLEGGLTKLVATMADAAAGGKETAEAFKSIGLNANDLIGLPLDEQLQRIADALDNVQGAEAKLAAVRKLFGRGGTALMPLLKESGAGIAGLQGRSGLLGATVKSQDAKDAVVLGDMLADVWTSAQSAVRAVGLAFLPLKDSILAVAEAVIVGAKNLREFIEENRNVIATVAAVAGGLVAAGGIFTGLGLTSALVATAIGGLASGASLLAAGFGLLLTPAGAVVALLGVIGVGFAKLWSMGSDGQKGIAQITSGFWELLGTAKAVGAGVGDALSVGDLGTAWKIVTTGLELEFAKVVSFWMDRWNTFKTFFVEGAHDAIKLTKLAWVGLGEWFNHLFLGIVKSMNDTFGKGIKTLLEKVASVISAGDPFGLFDDAVKTMRDIASGFGAAGFSDELKREQDKSKKEADAKRKEIEDLEAIAKEKRKNARDADLAAADAEVKRLQRQLAQLNEQAAEDAWQQALFDATFQGKLKGGAGAAKAVATEVRGGFGGQNARQIFAFGEKGTAEKTLAATEEIAGSNERIAKAVENLDGPAFA